MISARAISNPWALDGHKLMFHLDRVTEWQAGKAITPLYLSISPSSRCNRKCSFCIYHYKESSRHSLSLGAFNKVVPELKSAGVKALLFSGDGEPLVNPECVAMIQRAREEGIDVALNTNGSLLKREHVEILAKNLSWIRISFNAGAPQTYARIHGTHSNEFDRILETLRNLVRVRNQLSSQMTIGVQCLLLKENYREIGALAKILKSAGVDYLAVKPYLSHPLHPQADAGAIPDISEVVSNLCQLQALSDGQFSFVIRKSLFGVDEKRRYKQCLSLPFMGEIDAEGNVYACGPHLGDSRFCYGNIKAASFSEIWLGVRAQGVRQMVEQDWDLKNCLPNCRHDSVNEFLNSLKSRPRHVNFI